MVKIKSALFAAGVLLAISLTGCAGSSGSSSPRAKWTKECNNIGTVYCGIGVGVSTSEQMANDIAMTDATSNLAFNIEQDIEARMKNVGIQAGSGRADGGNKGNMASASEKIREVSKTLRNIRTQDIDVREINDEYQIYVFVTRPMDDALDQAKQELLAEQELKALQAEITKALTINTNVKEMLKKE